MIAPILAVAVALALAWRGAVPRGRRRRVRARVLVRALFPRRLIRSPSARLDIAGMVFSLFGLGALMGWALVSADWWAGATAQGLARGFGPAPPFAHAPPAAVSAVLALALFMAYEASYWLNHWMCHRFAALWAFHKVHHSATSLSPVTNFRVHPVDTLVFYNMASAATGTTAGVLHHLLGPGAGGGSVAAENLIVFLSSIVLTQLQHTHLWIPFTGRLGRWILSPAHHQLHHSADPRHHNRNFGSCLALFDRLAGSLAVPSRRRERLHFGIEDPGYDVHGADGALLRPFAEAARHLRPARSAGEAPLPVR